MTLQTGARIGAYEIVSPLGVGGMGEVYRARDTKLGRDVALKILPALFAADPDRLARFQREAQVLASLNHPNIGAIYGLEESEPSAGSGHVAVRALVLELVEGPTLAERIAQGPIPLDDSLPIARQIAEALEAAHEQGIVHRDLKPANIKLRPDGTVKVLDFGLAKLTETGGASRAGGAGWAGGSGGAGDIQASQSPTITTPAMTQMGTILGTAAYMSPEQAKGRPADKRSDVWAFGCVLYEMLTGKRAFEGEDVADTLAAVLRGDPDWSALPADTTRAIHTLVRHCLARDRRARIANISTANFLLDQQIVTELDTAVPTSATSASGSPRRARLWMAGAVALTIAVAGTTWMLLRRPTGPLRTMRFEITIPPSQTLTTGTLDRNIAISPDGTKLVYVSGAASQLMLRTIDRLDAAPLGQILAARFPFFSPDSKWVGYFAGNGELKKVSILGGPPIPICRYDGPPRGAAWGADDTIVFAAAANDGLRTVPAGGGEPQVITKPEPSTIHSLPSWLPDGRGVVFTVLGAAGANASIAVLDRRTGTRHVLLAGTEGEYVDSGHLVYVAQGTLRAVGFDAVSLAVVGNPVPLEQLATKGGQDIADFSVSRNGMLVFAAAGVDGQPVTNRTLVWVTRQGKEEAIDAPAHAYTSLRLSPDDSRIAVDVREQQNKIWVWDVRAQTLAPLTDGPGDQVPAWTPNGRRIAFSSQRGGPRGLFWRSADGSGALESLPDSGVAKQARWPGAFSSDGTLLVVTEIGDKTGDDISVVSLDRNQPPAVLLSTGYSERSPDLSFDGRWLAYQSNEDGGRDEIYVRPFPDVNGGRWPITTSGGTHPIWGKNGRELFFLDGEGFLTVAPIHTSPGFGIGRPTKLLQTKYFSAATRGAVYDVSRDGQRFVMIKGEEAAGRSSTLTVVLNWLEELKQRVPVK